jgi:hypothetical protein
MTIQLFDSLNKILKPLAPHLAIFLAMLVFLAASPAVQADTLPAEYAQTSSVGKIAPDTEPSAMDIKPAAIGKATIVLGKAYIESSQAGRKRIKSGTEIHVGDQITTRSNGTVLINFIDDASISVRQDSHLEITNYKFDKVNPQNSRVKFNLVHGVTRSISGKAAKGAREQFRLNTPIAAIGVRGTDFVVSATDSSTQAQVNEGIIVMAPFSVNCSTASFGPCLANSLELNGTSMDMIALDVSGSNPRILPAAQSRGAEVLQRKVRSQLANNANGEANGSAERFTEEAFVEEANSTLVATNTTTDPTLVDPALVDPIAVDPIVPEPELPIFTLETPAAAAELTRSQLVWGRFAAGKGDLERITLTRLEAAEDRAITVGDFDYVLYRDEGDATRVDRGLSVVNFALSSAQAFYNSSTGVVAMQVLDGSLGIDFQQNSFATELNLNHELTGQVDFVASGGLFDGGFFHSRNDTQRIAGAVSFDGTEAGYLFERQLEAGSIDGLTLWNSQ